MAQPASPSPALSMLPGPPWSAVKPCSLYHCSSPPVRWASAPGSHHCQLLELQGILPVHQPHFTDGKTEILETGVPAWLAVAAPSSTQPWDALPSSLALQVAPDAGQHPASLPPRLSVSCQVISPRSLWTVLLSSLVFTTPSNVISSANFINGLFTPSLRIINEDVR